MVDPVELPNPAALNAESYKHRQHVVESERSRTNDRPHGPSLNPMVANRLSVSQHCALRFGRNVQTQFQQIRGFRLLTRRSFADRISKIEKANPGPGEPIGSRGDLRAARSRGKFGRRLVFVLFPIIGIAARILTNIALEDEFTPDTPYYPHVMGFAAGFHIFMFVGVVPAILTFRRWPVFARAVFGAIWGYGIGAVMMLAND